MIDSDDTNKFIVTVLQIVNYCPQSRLSQSNLVREKESNNTDNLPCTLSASCWRTRT